MINSLLFHWHALRITVQQLLKGRFLVYFLPGLILTIAFVLFQLYLEKLQFRYLMKSEISWLDWMYSWVNAGTSTVFTIVEAIFVQLFIFTVLTLFSPFNTHLSERLDTQLTGQKFDHSWIRFFNDFIRMLFVVLLALIAELAFLFAYWSFSWIFNSALLDTVVYFTFAAFFFGFSFYDFSLERYGKGIFDTFNFSFSNPIKTILTGSLFLLIYKITYIGIPLAPILAVMISTIVYLYDAGKLPAIPTDTNTFDHE